MGLGLPDGGHLTHGYYTAKKKITASSIYFQSFPYQVDRSTGLIDYDTLETNANLFKPRLLVCGGSAYPRDWDYQRLRKVADQHGSYLLMDMAHISGLVSGKVQNSPFELCDVVTTTTHKTLRGPRAGLIFFRKDKEADLESRVNAAVFPACQGGPHNNTIAGIAVALKQASSPEFKNYAQAVIDNSRVIAEELLKHGYKLQTSGSDNHLVLWDLRPLGIAGSKIETICDLLHITLNKNAVAGDTSAVVPGGVRIGTAALTSRSMKGEEMRQVAQFLHRSVQIAIEAQKLAGNKLLKNFVQVVNTNEKISNDVKTLNKEVHDFSIKFPLPGIPDTSVIQSPSV